MISSEAEASQDSREAGTSILLLTYSALALCILLLRPVVGAVTGALLLYAFTCRLYRWLLRRLASATAAASAVVCVTTLSLVIPSVFAVRLVGAQAFQGIALIRETMLLPKSMDLFGAASRPSGKWASFLGSDMLIRLTQQILGSLSEFVLTFLGRTVGVVTQSFIMLFLLFFLLRDGDEAALWMEKYVPLAPAEYRLVRSRAKRAVRATLFGSIVIAAVQALLSWILFEALRIPGSLLLANLTFICALIPTFGAVLVWLPVTLWLLAIHAWTRALVLLIVGTLLVSTADNVLYPMLIGVRAKMHTAPMFLALLGGIWMFGISGIFLGPLLLTLTGVLLEIAGKRGRRQNKHTCSAV